MRQHEWYQFLDSTMPRRGPIEFIICDGFSHTQATVTEVLDSRHGPVDTEGLTSLNNPLIRNRDGLRFMADGTERYVAAAYLCASCWARERLILSREKYYDEYPAAIRTLLIEREAALIATEAAMTAEDFYQHLAAITLEVSDLVQAEVVSFPTAEQAFDGGHQAGMQFLRAQLATGRYHTIASIAQYASWRAKDVQRRGGDATELYRFKDECLNHLLRHHLSRHDHEQIDVDVQNGMLTIVTGLGISIMGLHTILNQRGMHLPKDRITKEARRKLKYLHPELWAKLAL